MPSLPRVAAAKKQVEVFLRQGAFRWVPLLHGSAHSPEPLGIFCGLVADRCPRGLGLNDVFDLNKELFFAQESQSSNIQILIVPECYGRRWRFHSQYPVEFHKLGYLGPERLQLSLRDRTPHA